MGLLDEAKDKMDDLTKNPEAQQRAEETAKDFAEQHNISVDEAKKRLFGDDK